MKTVFNPLYLSNKNIINQFVTSFFIEGKILVKGSRNIIKIFDAATETYNIKYFKKPTFLKAIIYSYFKKSKAQRSYEYANYLISNTINTPVPIAYFENRNFFWNFERQLLCVPTYYIRFYYSRAYS